MITQSLDQLVARTRDYLGASWFPQSVVSADIVVSMPKVKTHHWAGVTLSMKNMFGIISGVVYGWPKNLLHWHGIERSILDICSAMRPHFVIADGIVAMEGNGPLHGTGRALNKIVLSDDPAAADFTCARLMGLLPEKIYHLEQAARFLGSGAVEMIQMLDEEILERIEPFAVLPQFEHLRRHTPCTKSTLMGRCTHCSFKRCAIVSYRGVLS